MEDKLQQPSFPQMRLAVVPQGMLVVQLHTPYRKEEILIPGENADQLAIDWILSRPGDVLRALLVAAKKKREQAETEGAVIRDLRAGDRRLA